MKNELKSEVAKHLRVMKTQENIWLTRDENKPEVTASKIVSAHIAEFGDITEYGREWMYQQCKENKLHDNSSGSFLVALTDFDGMSSALSLEDESEEDFEEAQEMFKVLFH